MQTRTETQVECWWAVVEPVPSGLKVPWGKIRRAGKTKHPCFIVFRPTKLPGAGKNVTGRKQKKGANERSSATPPNALYPAQEQVPGKVRTPTRGGKNAMENVRTAEARQWNPSTIYTTS